MPKLTIDGKEISVPEGSTLLDAAEQLGIDIPHLCFLKGEKPSTSCFACVVKQDGKVVPSCATTASEGMIVESETEEIRHLRKTSLELLLSDHLGDCVAPCEFGCPANMNIPAMLRAIERNDMVRAIEVVKRDIALPSVLGRICPAPCEKVCRRKDKDTPIAICQLKRYVGDYHLGLESPYQPKVAPPSDKSVAIVGAGSTGLSAAYYLSSMGHQVHLYEREEHAGGRLRAIDDDLLPHDVLDAEIDSVLSLPIHWHPNAEIEFEQAALDRWQSEHDVVLLACGSLEEGQIRSLGLQPAKKGIQWQRGTYQAGREGLFAAGSVIRGKGMVIRCVADGKEAARSIDHSLRKGSPLTLAPPYSVRLKRLDQEELEQLAASAQESPRDDHPDGGMEEYSVEEAAVQSARCLHCDCRARDDCRLLEYSREYQARVNHFRESDRMPMVIRRSGNLLYEPGKCIRCGICVTIAQKRGEPLGLAFIGRGFDVRIDVPFRGDLEEALKQTAAECVKHCPTAALEFDRDD